MPFDSLADVPVTVQPAADTISGIAWKPALQAALIVAVPAAVLCSELTAIGQALGLAWMIGAGAWAVSLYARRTRLGGMTMASGARIGLVTGLLVSWLTMAVNGGNVWFQRFVLHQGSQMDATWLADVDRSLLMSQQMSQQWGMTVAQAAQSTQTSRIWMLSPEGHVGIALFTLLVGTAFFIIFSIMGGAAGARFLVPARRPNA